MSVLSPNVSVGQYVTYHLTSTDAATVGRATGEAFPMMIENIDASGNLHGKVIVDVAKGDTLYPIIPGGSIGEGAGQYSYDFLQ